MREINTKEHHPASQIYVQYLTKNIKHTKKKSFECKFLVQYNVMYNFIKNSVQWGPFEKLMITITGQHTLASLDQGSALTFSQEVFTGSCSNPEECSLQTCSLFLEFKTSFPFSVIRIFQRIFKLETLCRPTIL